MSGALMQLVAYNDQNINILNLNGKTGDDKYSHRIEYESFGGSGLTRVITITRNGDQWKPEHIVMEQTDENIKLKTVYLEMGGQIIMEFDIDFMRQLFPDMIKIKDNKVIYNLNYDKFNNNKYINLISMSFHEVKIIIKLVSDDGINNIKLLNSYKYLETNPRRIMAQNNNINKEHLILQHQTIETYSDNKKIRYFTLNFNGISNGIFIEISSGIDNIKSIKMTLNGQLYKEYDIDIIDYIGHRFNDNMIFIPFCQDVNFLSTDVAGALNFSCVDLARISIEGIESLGFIKIHTHRINILKYGAGMSSLNYNYESDNINSYVIVNRFNNHRNHK